jgi:hypothetical protein
MPIQIQGNGGVVSEVDGTAFRALRITSRPLDHGALGHYQWSGITGVLPAALAANSEIFQFRWTDATRLAVITEIKYSASVSTTMFAAGVPCQNEIRTATAWTGQGTLGTGITPGADMKMRTSMGSSLLAAGDMRIATTAALGVGTKTLSAHPISSHATGGPITASLNGTIVPYGTALFRSEISDGQHPLVLGTNEGFVIRSVAVPATGTWMAAMIISWTEVAVF